MPVLSSKTLARMAKMLLLWCNLRCFRILFSSDELLGQCPHRKAASATSKHNKISHLLHTPSSYPDPWLQLPWSIIFFWSYPDPNLNFNLQIFAQQSCSCVIAIVCCINLASNDCFHFTVGANVSFLGCKKHMLHYMERLAVTLILMIILMGVTLIPVQKIISPAMTISKRTVHSYPGGSFIILYSKLYIDNML